MGKRSNFDRNHRDFYPTPFEAVPPLLKRLHVVSRVTRYIEPCAGDGRLVRHLARFGMVCNYACDIDPQESSVKIEERDVLFFPEQFRLPDTDLIITNPPWERGVLHAMIEVFRAHAPTWLLIDADWMFTGQAKPYLAFCKEIVSIGRLSWMDNGVSGKDNCCWYQFIDQETETTFWP